MFPTCFKDRTLRHHQKSSEGSELPQQESCPRESYLDPKDQSYPCCRPSYREVWGGEVLVCFSGEGSKAFYPIVKEVHVQKEEQLQIS